MLLTGWTFPLRSHSKISIFTLRNQTSDRFDQRRHLVASKHVVLGRISQNVFAFLKVCKVGFSEGGRAVFVWGVGAFDFRLVRVSTIHEEMGIVDCAAGSISRASASEDALEPG